MLTDSNLFHMNILFGLSETILPKPPWAANLEVPNVRLSSPAPESSITANDNHQIAENQDLDQLQNLFKQRSIHLPKFHPNCFITLRDKRWKPSDTLRAVSNNYSRSFLHCLPLRISFITNSIITLVCKMSENNEKSILKGLNSTYAPPKYVHRHFNIHFLFKPFTKKLVTGLTWLIQGKVEHWNTGDSHFGVIGTLLSN